MNLRHYRYWFYAAAIYNLIWGTLNIVFPTLVFQMLGMPPPNYLPLWQVVGMFVLAYAPAYWWAARYPDRHPQLILIGLLGKILGPLGFFWSAITGNLPWSFGWTIITNDLIWLPAFILYLSTMSETRGGIIGILRGE